MKVLALLLVGCFAAGSILAGADMMIPDATFNFGKISQHRTLTHHFWIKSTGDDTLRILEIDPGCGCTEIPLKDSVLAPGDSTAMGVVFKTGRFRSHVIKKPTVLSNASPDKTVLQILSEVVLDPEADPTLVVRPDRVDVSQFGEKSRRRARFHLENRSDHDLNLQVADSSFKSFELEIPGKIKAGETVEGLVTVRKELVNTEFEESITLEVTGVDRNIYSIMVQRRLRPGR
ncbi:MAG: DUF1573 domain-containing protein [candidate division Zixibacteria bacterium]|nr:DUF1573 domain-containing protein [candidate division Zixibacteria bacterium]